MVLACGRQLSTGISTGRFIGYYSPYATSHRALDEDRGVQREAENAAAAVAQTVLLRREGKLPAVGSDLAAPRSK